MGEDSTKPALDLRGAGIGANADTPGVIAPPPLVYLCSILAGWVLQYLWPLEVLPARMGTALGGPVILVAVVFFVLCIRELRAAGTSIQTRRPTTVIIRTGPYRFSRNPIYLSLTLFQIGVGIWVNSVWILGMVVPTLVLMSYGVIGREERYLGRKFGEEYLQYKSLVRRWL